MPYSEVWCCHCEHGSSSVIRLCLFWSGLLLLHNSGTYSTLIFIPLVWNKNKYDLADVDRHMTC
jgi:hypothetical protein